MLNDLYTTIHNVDKKLNYHIEDYTSDKDLNADTNKQIIEYLEGIMTKTGDTNNDKLNKLIKEVELHKTRSDKNHEEVKRLRSSLNNLSAKKRVLEKKIVGLQKDD